MELRLSSDTETAAIEKEDEEGTSPRVSVHLANKVELTVEKRRAKGAIDEICDLSNDRTHETDRMESQERQQRRE